MLGGGRSWRADRAVEKGKPAPYYGQSDDAASIVTRCGSCNPFHLLLWSGIAAKGRQEGLKSNLDDWRSFFSEWIVLMGLVLFLTWLHCFFSRQAFHKIKGMFQRDIFHPPFALWIIVDYGSFWHQLVWFFQKEFPISHFQVSAAKSRQKAKADFPQKQYIWSTAAGKYIGHKIWSEIYWLQKIKTDFSSKQHIEHTSW